MLSARLWPVTLALCFSTVCWCGAVPVSQSPIEQEQQLAKFEIGPVTKPIAGSNVSVVETTTSMASRLVLNTLSSTTATLNGKTEGGGYAASTLAVSSPMTTTLFADETTTFRFDAESSAESFESAEATSATAVGRFQVASSVASTKSSVNTGEPIIASQPKSSPPSWPWMVFVLNGNATVAARRQRDLGTYLRLNLAARLDADYNDVAINRILLTPQAVLANISVEPSHLVYGGTGAAGLEALGQGNVTLLELSGHEFQVDRIIRFDDIVDQRGMMSSLEMSSMTAAVSSEVTVYGAVGAVFLFLLVALLLGLSFSSPCKAGDNGKYLSSNNLGYDRDQMDSYSEGAAEWRESLSTATPPVIYTEQLAREMGDGLLTSSHFIPSRPSPSTIATLAELHQHCQDPGHHQS